MAKQVKLAKGQEFTFETPKAGGESKHPWDEWLNGDLLMLEQSTGKQNEYGAIIEVDEKKDFEVAMGQMPNRLKQAARKRYKVVQVSRKDAKGNRLKNALIIKARDMDAAERIEEDRLRAEEKEAKKAKKALQNGYGGNHNDDDDGDENE